MIYLYKCMYAKAFVPEKAQNKEKPPTTVIEICAINQLRRSKQRIANKIRHNAITN